MADSRFQSPFFEINVAHHCNLSCRGCSHLSPVSAKEYVAADALKEDLRKLAKVYCAERVRLLGGEPLLHPHLLEVIRAVRGSGIARRIVIATNGTLLSKQTEAFWSSVDEVNVTLYPGSRLSPYELLKCGWKAKRHRVQLRVSLANRFRESYSEVGTADERLVKRIHDTCLIAHRWSCHNVEKGYFYKCPQAIVLPKQLEGKFSSPTSDGIRISEEPGFAQQLRDYLASETPLGACRHCLGSAGKLFPHSQVARPEFRGRQNAPTESLLDETRLVVLETEPAEGEDTHQGFAVRSPFDLVRLLPRLLGAGA